MVSSVPRLVPSRRNCTPLTPTLSEALAEIVIVPEIVAPEAGDVMETEGACESIGGGTAAVVKEKLEETARLPAASRDLTR